MILGDHPGCRSGVPVTLEWDYLEYERLSVDDYEIHHALRRPLIQMYMTPLQRQEMLKDIGYSAGDMAKAKRQVNKAGNQWFWTKEITQSPLMSNLDGGLRSLRRQVKRAFGTKLM
mmetsp:Transcript_13784/g.26447  ORF Transcript_13784/g.26447 Transcript_13784/m.26447 type:complete len:116 (+) Transcript_13784:775-1122(+)